MSPEYREMSSVFGRIGLLSFGGPAAQIALMHRELVENHRWLTEESYLRALSLCMLLPGPEAMQLATYAGWRLRGVPGGLLAGGLFVLPGAFVIAILVGLYSAFGDLPLIQSVFLGVKAAVIAIVLQALLKLSAKAMGRRDAKPIAGAAFLAIFALNLPFPLIILFAALWGYFTTDALPASAPPSAPVRSRPWRTLAIWLPLWLGPLAFLSLTNQTFLADIGWFFAWLAVITFGGAYAVLAYLTQTVVDQYHWITTAQMIDALGLAETTPGPLILVTQFVAMLAGQLQGGPALALMAGAVALWATFVPCFLWIFLAAPYLEKLASLPRLSAGLQAISAAVVGVILNLSVWFAMHVLFLQIGSLTLGPLSVPWPDVTTLNLRALALTTLAGLWMFGLRRGLAETLAICATAGAASHFL